MASPDKPEPAHDEPALALAKLPAELADELELAMMEVERGACLQLTPDELDAWADRGVVPWPDEFQA